MGVITKEVEVRLNGNNVNRYKKLGYDIPMRKASMSTKHEICYVADFKKTILVKIEDLPLNSRAIIESTCDYCGKLKPSTRYSDYNKQTKNGMLKCCCSECASLKHKEIMFEKYGCEGAMQIPEIREKVLQTNLRKYGCKTPSQSLEVRKKIMQAFYKNSSQKSSRQQRYINNLYHGTLNFPIKFYCADISCDNLIVEFDGSGHALSVAMGHETIDEYRRKEIVRHNVIKNEGYKQMRIISTKDKLPSDKTLLQMLYDAKQYFLNYPTHSWIEFNIDTFTVRNAEHKNGILYDYGELRKIKDLDLSKHVV